jgi:nitrate/nitrite transporter NarK
MRRLPLICLVFGGGAIYLLPYLRQSFHQTMLRAFGLDNRQLGKVSSAYGLLAMLSYVPGGWLADVLSPRLLITGSLAASGAIGLYLAGFPDYRTTLGLHAVLGVVSIMTFWPSVIRAVRHLARPEAQGRAFGFYEAGTGAVQALVTSVGVALFARYAVEVQGLAAVIRLISILLLTAAVAVWISMAKTPLASRPAVAGRRRPGGGLRSGLRGVLEALRLPAVWLTALVVLGAYWAYWGAYDLAAFARDAFESDAAEGATLSSYRMWFRVLAPLVTGWIADRRTASGTSFVCMSLLTAAFVLLGLMPTGETYRWLLWFDTTLLAAALFGVRGVYFALVEEGKVPSAITGRAVGIISIVGFVPDFIAPLVLGELLHRYALVRGHQLFYLGIAAVSLVGALAAFGVHRMNAPTATGQQPGGKR